MTKVSRRGFVKFSMMGMGGAVVSTGLGGVLVGCSGDDDADEIAASFDHGVASGDPLSDRVILWTRVTPVAEADREGSTNVRVSWEVATDENFSSIVVSGSATTNAGRDFTMKVDASNLTPGTVYYYRFSTASSTSVVGRTKTLPEGETDQARFVVVSCSNYPAGHFHAYAEAAKQDGVDASIHLGDYLYEYARGGFASEDAQTLGREVLPEGELLTLSDYRTRYAQYRTDPDLQTFHQAMPMIAVWDDHEVANDTWREGAENHDPETQGSFAERLLFALQAYAEWMPIRPPVDNDVSSLARNFQYGDLVNLIMLDTRIVGRDLQLSLASYFGNDGNFDVQRYTSEILDNNRTLLGTDQLNWLQEQLATNTRWQALGQQVLMGRMELPGAVATAQLSIEDYVTLVQLAQADPLTLSPEQAAFLQARGPLLQLPSLPYNLDAWDGYPAEREQIYQTAQDNSANLVVLAGDTHNGWASNLKTSASVGNASVGVEFATPGVSSPGLESFLNLSSEQAIMQTEGGLTQLIENLNYTNLSDRGFLMVTFTANNVTADWIYVSSVKENTYQTLPNRNRQIVVNAGANVISDSV